MQHLNATPEFIATIQDERLADAARYRTIKAAAAARTAGRGSFRTSLRRRRRPLLDRRETRPRGVTTG